MQVSSASASALAGMSRAERALDASADAVTRAFVPADPSAVSVSRLGSSDPLDGAGDIVAPMIQMIAAQRAFTASLAVLRADDEMQRAFLERTR
jgi:flagellar basal body rod protein FlgC